MSIANYLEEAWLKTLRGGGNGTAFSAPANVYVQQHTGDPGEDGTANVATETTRQRVTFAAPANPAGTMDSNIDVNWTNVAGTETYRFWTLWDATSGGNCLYVGTLTADRSVTAGDNFTYLAGRLQLVLA